MLSLIVITTSAESVRLQFNMAMVLFLFLLAIRLAIVRGIICIDDPTLDRDAFEEHGCTCGTESIRHADLFTIFHQAYEDCHEGDYNIQDRYTIDCAISTKGNDAHFIMSSLNRTVLNSLPVVDGDFYQNITCL